jgi:DNA-binding CsgD family transcriptional regulator
VTKDGPSQEGSIRSSQAIERLRSFSFAGIGFYWAWIYYALFTTNLFEYAIDTRFSSEISELFSFVAYTLVMLIAVARRKPLVTTKNKWKTDSLPPLASIGTAVMVIAAMNDTAIGLGAMLIAATLTGLGTAYLLLMWGRLYLKMSPRIASLRLACGLAVSAVMYLMLIALPLIVSIVICSLLPLFSWLAFRFSAKNAEFSLRPGGVNELSVGRSKLTYPLRFGLALTATGLVYGWIMGLSFQTAGASYQSMLIIIINVALATAVFLLMQVFRNIGFNSTYRAILPLMGMALVFSGLPGMAGNGVSFFLARFSYSLFDILIWLQLPNIFMQTRSTRLFCFSRLCLDGSALIGTLVTRISFGNSVSEPSFQIELLVFSCLLFVVLAATLTSRNIESAWNLIPALRNEAQDLDSVCKLLTGRYRLTNREEEIMVLLARGRSAPYIESKLEIKLNTVQSHTKNLYRKLDIHSRQELLSLIEEQMEQTLGGSGAD